MSEERWIHELKRDRHDAAWDAFVARYQKLILATIRQFTRDHDDVMDVFARVCDALRADGMARLRRYTESSTHTARFSTWLVVVIRNLAIDWYRSQAGRRRLSVAAERLTPLRQAIFREVFQLGRSHAEAYEILRAGGDVDLGFGAFLRELAAVYRAVGFRTRERTPVLPAESDDPVDPAALAEMRQILDTALAALRPTERLAVRLYVVDEVPAADVARVTGLANAKAVYNCVYRALATARVELERAGYRRDML